MNEIVKPLGIEPAFDDRAGVRALSDVSAPYGAAAACLPHGSDDSEGPLRADRVRILAILNADLSRPDAHLEQSTQPFSDQWLGIVYGACMRAARATTASAPAS
jgi:hypothetical protein